MLITSAAREAEKTRINIRKSSRGRSTFPTRAKFVDCRTKDVMRANFTRRGRFGARFCKLGATRVQAISPCAARSSSALSEDDKIFKKRHHHRPHQGARLRGEGAREGQQGAGGFDLDTCADKVIFAPSRSRRLPDPDVILTCSTLVPKLIEKGFVYIAESRFTRSIRATKRGLSIPTRRKTA